VHKFYVVERYSSYLQWAWCCHKWPIIRIVIILNVESVGGEWKKKQNPIRCMFCKAGCKSTNQV